MGLGLLERGLGLISGRFVADAYKKYTVASAPLREIQGSSERVWGCFWVGIRQV